MTAVGPALAWWPGPPRRQPGHRRHQRPGAARSAGTSTPRAPGRQPRARSGSAHPHQRGRDCLPCEELLITARRPAVLGGRGLSGDHDAGCPDLAIRRARPVLRMVSRNPARRLRGARDMGPCWCLVCALMASPQGSRRTQRRTASADASDPAAAAGYARATAATPAPCRTRPAIRDCSFFAGQGAVLTKGPTSRWAGKEWVLASPTSQTAATGEGGDVAMALPNPTRNQVPRLALRAHRVVGPGQRGRLPA